MPMENLKSPLPPHRQAMVPTMPHNRSPGHLRSKNLPSLSSMTKEKQTHALMMSKTMHSPGSPQRKVYPGKKHSPCLTAIITTPMAMVYPT